MIRAFVSVLVLISASTAFAGESCENLVLNCVATYQAFDGTTASVQAPTSAFADENPYEPSLANCAATLYFPEVDGEFKTIVGVRATKDLQSGLFTVTAGAGQLQDSLAGRISKRTEWTTTSSATIEMAQNIGSITVEEPFKVFGNAGKTIYLGCKPSKAN